RKPEARYGRIESEPSPGLQNSYHETRFPAQALITAPNSNISDVQHIWPEWTLAHSGMGTKSGKCEVKRRISLGALLVSTTLLSTVCLALLERDFDKLTRVGEFRLGSAEIFRQTVNLPSGSAQLILAIPNYRCAAVGEDPVTFTVRSDKGVEFSERVLISQLTWSYAQDSCDALGYLRAEAGRNQSMPGRGTMTLEITHDQTPITVEVDTRELKTSTPRNASVWFIYGGRAPLDKIFGPLPEGKSGR